MSHAATGLLNNSSAAFNMTADAVTEGTEIAIEALSFALGNNGGREIRGQLFVTTPASTTGAEAYSQGALLPWFSDGITPVAYSDGTTSSNVRGAGTLLGTVAAEQTSRVDFTATLQDAAFEEYDIFGGQRSPRSDRSNTRF